MRKRDPDLEQEIERQLARVRAIETLDPTPTEYQKKSLPRLERFYKQKSKVLALKARAGRRRAKRKARK